jgi:hypothetical protein
MRYMLLIYINEGNYQGASKDAATKTMAAYLAYTDAMKEAGVKEAGVWLDGGRLRPTSMATSVRFRDGQKKVLDGPYADTKEQLGGYYMIEAPDMDVALSWASRCPGAQYGTIEVRPIWEYPE